MNAPISPLRQILDDIRSKIERLPVSELRAELLGIVDDAIDDEAFERTVTSRHVVPDHEMTAAFLTMPLRVQWRTRVNVEEGALS